MPCERNHLKLDTWNYDELWGFCDAQIFHPKDPQTILASEKPIIKAASLSFHSSSQILGS